MLFNQCYQSAHIKNTSSLIHTIVRNTTTKLHQINKHFGGLMYLRKDCIALLCSQRSFEELGPPGTIPLACKEHTCSADDYRDSNCTLKKVQTNFNF